MRIVIALGGNALLRRGQPMTAQNQRENVRIAAEQISKVYKGNELVIAHGNGPQVGLLALQGTAYYQHVDNKVEAYPLDVLGAETQGMIGYMIEQEMGNLLPKEVPFATLLTQVEVDKAAETARLTKEAEKLQKALDKLNAKLSKPGYTEKAPAHLVEKDKADLAELEDKMAKVQNQLAKLKG